MRPTPGEHQIPVSSSDDIILVRDRYYILATSALADDRTLVLKHGDTFGVFDRYGDLQPLGRGRQGLFHEDTRYLSRLELRLGLIRPLLLSATVTDDNGRLTADLTNPDLNHGDGAILPRDTIHVFRTAFLWKAACHIRLRVHNFAAEPVPVAIVLRFAADFADIFEVRGTSRSHRGVLLEPALTPTSVRIRYRGLDDLVRATRLDFEPTPAELTADTAQWNLVLGPGEDAELHATVHCEPGDQPSPVLGFEAARQELTDAAEAARARWCRVETSNEQLNDWLGRSSADLRMMVTDTAQGPYPYAGVPWFSTAFGRDGIITALETLWINPDLAAGVLRYLAATQATEQVPERDAEPGKILHEVRFGEMARLREVPFDRYYGTVDATPLFVILAGAYYRHTGDGLLIDAIWPHIERAVGWMLEYGDLDRDGFVEYARRDERGLVNQGWKDSGDSVFHADGVLAHGPIAICEVQAYAHGALVVAADLAELLGHAARAAELRRRADDLRLAFERTFWCEELGTYALALDGNKRPCAVRASNAGHALFTGTASRDRAARVARTLLGGDSFSGWGVRTLSARERRYNPMSYHNGSVWPHDTALIAAGMARYGLKDEALRIFTGLFDASLFVDLHRLPELFCGFPRRPAEGPTLYPVACAPQAWAAGAVYLVLQACLGLSVDGARQRLELDRPVLPGWLHHLELRGLRVGAGQVDLDLRRHRDDVGVNVTRREGAVEVVVVK